jgi:hypothetical protein
MKIQVRSLAIALAIAVPLAVTATAQSSAAPINGTSIRAPGPALTMDVRYQARRGHPDPSYSAYPTDDANWGYPAYSSYWGDPIYNSYYRAYGYGSYRSGCAPGPRVGAFATAPWANLPTCPPY